MTHVLAAEGGYQQFHLASGEWLILIGSALTALLAIGVGFFLMRRVLAEDQGTPKMQEIAKAIQEGAMAYLRRQFRTILFILVPLAVIVFVTSTKVLKPDHSTALSLAQSGIFRTLAFLAGCTMSGLTGFIGMSLAVRGNVRTAAAAKTGSMPAALKIAFRTGGVAGMFTVGLGLIGATFIIMLFQNTSSTVLIGFGFGGSLLALFLRVGGGIFTKAADVGADLVGKVEVGIPEDDPRNPATIADNVGDNVGDCAGMAADLFESYAVTLVAALILGQAAFGSQGLVFPLIVPAIGVITALVGIYATAPRDSDRNGMAAINRGFYISAVLSAVLVAIAAYSYLPSTFDALHGGTTSDRDPRLIALVAVIIGIVLASLIQVLTGYFTETARKPVREIGRSSLTGPATVILAGISVGLESAVYSALLIGGAVYAAFLLGGGSTVVAL